MTRLIEWQGSEARQPIEVQAGALSEQTEQFKIDDAKRGALSALASLVRTDSPSKDASEISAPPSFFAMGANDRSGSGEWASF